MMNKIARSRKTLLVAVTALTIAGSVTGVALAAGGSKAPKAPAVEVTTPDTDNVQSGDQTSPDIATKATEKASVVGAKSTSSASETGSEDPSAETGGTENGVETGGVSDGPGGHADPPGNVNHEFNGEE